MKLYIEMNSNEVKAINKMMVAMGVDDQVIDETMNESVSLKAGRFHTEIDDDLGIKAEVDLKEGFFTFVCQFMERIGRIVLPAIQMVMEATELFSDQIQEWSEPEEDGNSSGSNSDVEDNSTSDKQTEDGHTSEEIEALKELIEEDK